MTNRDARTNDEFAGWAARVGAAIVAVGGVGVVGYGLTWIVEDESTQGEMLDGLGTFIGLVVCGMGVLLLALARFASWLVRRRPLAGAVVLTSFGLLVAAAGGVAIGAIGFALSAAMVFGGLFVAGIAFGAALVAGGAIDSTRGISR